MSSLLRKLSLLSDALRCAAPGLLAGLAIVSGCAIDGAADDDHRGAAAPAGLERLHRADLAGMPVRAGLAATAVDYLRAAAVVADPARSGWQLRSLQRGADGLNHLRIDQTLDGVRVWGADVVVHASDAAVQSVDGTFVRDLAGVATRPTLSAADALAAAEARYAAVVPDQDARLGYDREATELVILPRDGEAPRLVWHTLFHTELQGGMNPGQWNAFVDADSGELLAQWNGLDTLAQATGPGGNGRVWTAALDVEPSGSAYAMETTRLRTTNLDHATSGAGTLVTGPLVGIGDPAINDAHGFAEVTLGMLSDWMGRNSIDDAGKVIKSRVHYGNSHPNAFWDGTQMTYGDGNSQFYPLSSALDVVAHEINHGFTYFHSRLIYAGQPGALNESFSDIAGTIAEFYQRGSAADFDLGRDVRRDGSAVRFMCNPTADGISIDHVDHYNDALDVHQTSGIMNKAFCRSARRLGSGSPGGAATPDSVRRAGQAWYLANASYWTASTSFVQACQGVLSAARALHFPLRDVEAIRQSWIDVGVTCEGTPILVPPADYDGDGKADRAIKDGSGTWRIDHAADGFGAWDAAYPGYGIDSEPVPADYDGDGKADLSVKDLVGTWYIDYAANGFGVWDVAYAGYGNAADAVPADYDGDGKADLAVKNAVGTWYIDFAANGFGTWDVAYAGYDDASAIPVPADYDGDGKTDLAIKNAAGAWYIDHAANGFGVWDVAYPGYGGSGAIPVPADYDGDGRTDLSVKDASGIWYIDFAADGFGDWNVGYPGYGGSVSTPLPADHDGDGRADLAVVDYLYWYIDHAADGFGSWNQDIPATY